MVEAEIYKALGDPVRLEMVKRLSAGAANTIGELSADLGISRQGARKQLQVLLDANIVHLARKGRESRVTLDTRTLEIARAFIVQLENEWDARLEALKEFVER